MGFKRVKVRGAPDWLYQRQLKGSLKFWIRFRRGGICLEECLKAETVRAASEEGQELLAKALGGRTEGRPVALVRLEDLCKEVVALKVGKSAATYELNEIMARVHVIPYLNEFCPYLTDFNSATWDHYAVWARTKNPTVALFNHWKFFVNLANHAFKKGLLRQKLSFAFDEEREDFREEGQVIPDEELARLIQASRSVWRDRIFVQRFTGMRPGEVRCLRKDRVAFDGNGAVVKLLKEDTKTRTARSFRVRSPIVLEVLRRRMALESEFFFPARGRAHKPMESSLKGWHAALARAGIEKNYTPHDLRHTFLNNEFKKPGANPALICFMAGLSIKEAQETYLHFTADDTSGMAEDLARESGLLRA